MINLFQCIAILLLSLHLTNSAYAVKELGAGIHWYTALVVDTLIKSNPQNTPIPSEGLTVHYISKSAFMQHEDKNSNCKNIGLVPMTEEQADSFFSLLGAGSIRSERTSGKKCKELNPRIERQDAATSLATLSTPKAAIKPIVNCIVTT